MIQFSRFLAFLLIISFSLVLDAAIAVEPKKTLEDSLEPQISDYADHYSYLVAWKCWDLKRLSGQSDDQRAIEKTADVRRASGGAFCEERGEESAGEASSRGAIQEISHAGHSEVVIIGSTSDLPQAMAPESSMAEVWAVLGCNAPRMSQRHPSGVMSLDESYLDSEFLFVLQMMDPLLREELSDFTLRARDVSRVCSASAPSSRRIRKRQAPVPAAVSVDEDETDTDEEIYRNCKFRKLLEGNYQDL